MLPTTINWYACFGSKPHRKKGTSAHQKGAHRVFCLDVFFDTAVGQLSKMVRKHFSIPRSWKKLLNVLEKLEKKQLSGLHFFDGKDDADISQTRQNTCKLGRKTFLEPPKNNKYAMYCFF